MLSVFWSRDGILHLDVLDKSQTINGAYYADLLEAAFSKFSRNQVRNKFLLHDNAPVHTAGVVREKLSQMKLKALQHPPYSPDLAPSDFCLFRHLKKQLRGNSFATSSDVKQHVVDTLKELDVEFFRSAFDDLVTRWKKCVQVNGFYVEK